MPNWVQNEIIFENASDEKVAALIRELKLATESDERAFDFNKEKTNKSILCTPI